MKATDNPRNDKITTKTKELGYCCPYAFLCKNSGKRDTNKKLADKLDMCLSAIEFNRRKFKKGTLKCLGLRDCQIPKED